MNAGLVGLLVQTGAAWYGAGFIWTMQVLNYPLLALVGRDSFAAYERSHNQRFIRVVGPGVLLAVISTAFVLVSPPGGVPTAAVLLSALLLLVIIVATVAFQAPALHPAQTVLASSESRQNLTSNAAQFEATWLNRFSRLPSGSRK